MSMIRPLLLSLAALLIVPATAHAEDDDVCVGWVHSFIDAEVDGNTLTVTSENTCLMHASSLDELEPYADGKPYRIGFPGFSGSRVCAAREREIDDMRRALEEANKGWDEAVAALDAATTEKCDARTAYDQAYAAWLAAQIVTNAAKAAYADVYEVVVETERDRAGLVVVVRQIGYRGDTEDSAARYWKRSDERRPRGGRWRRRTRSGMGPRKPLSLASISTAASEPSIQPPSMRPKRRPRSLAVSSKGYLVGHRGRRGTNADTRCWYARYASRLLRSACASVAGMPVTSRMLARIVWPPS